MNILAWVILVLAIIELIFSPINMGKDMKKTGVMISMAIIVWSIIALFAGIYLFQS